jgi:Tfp pilus assembly protein PilF
MRRYHSGMGTAWLLALASGCSWMWVKDDTVRPPLPGPGDHIVKDSGEPSGPKRTPKAITCVKWGDLLAATAAEMPQGSEQNKKYDQARLAYEQALDIDPSNQDALLGLARLYEKSGKPDDAQATYQRAVKQLPREAQVWFEYGMFANRRRDFDSGAAYMRQAASLEPTNATYGSFLGWSLARAGRSDESLAQFKQTVGEARAYYNLAKMCLHQHQEALCREYLHVALKVDPNLKDAEQLIAQLDAPAKPDEEPAAEPEGTPEGTPVIRIEEESGGQQ